MLIMSLFKRSKPPLRSVLFVCTANVTRSPVAELLFRQLAEKSGEKWLVGSAGVNTREDLPSNKLISNFFLDRYKPLRKHKSRQIDKRLLGSHSWIFVMEEAHRQALASTFPEYAERIFVLRNFGMASPVANPDVPDPTNDKDPKWDDYMTMLNILEEEIPRIYNILQMKISDLSMENE
jgi:protein-tyrosine phosphatase